MRWALRAKCKGQDRIKDAAKDYDESDVSEYVD